MLADLNIRLTRRDCRKGFHLWKVVDDDEQVTIEECEVCGMRMGYNKVGGKVDPRKWAANHKLDLLQPFGKTARDFNKYYAIDR
jgi:hypothetical protein